ncbi:MAG: hypothetical protein J4G12_08685 [Gemmatimonadetes bacterium]|nr:hypothetical protein [Gemmatimonadota bacterium]
MRNFAYAAMGGAVVLLALKLLAPLVLPIFGILFGIFATFLKVALIGAGVWLLWRFMKSQKKGDCC